MEKISMENQNISRNIYQPDDLVCYAHLQVRAGSGEMQDFTIEIFEKGEEASTIPLCGMYGEGIPTWKASLSFIDSRIPREASFIPSITKVLDSWFLSCKKNTIIKGLETGRYLLHFEIYDQTANRSYKLLKALWISPFGDNYESTPLDYKKNFRKEFSYLKRYNGYDTSR